MRYKSINNFHNETNKNQLVMTIFRIVVKIPQCALCCVASKIPNLWEISKCLHRFDRYEARDKVDSSSYNRLLLLS
jgi:hypothetical protein